MSLLQLLLVDVVLIFDHQIFGNRGPGNCHLCSFVLQFRNSDSDIIEIQIKFRTRLVHNRSGQTMRRWKDIFIRMKFAFFKPFRKSLIHSLKLSLTLGTGRLLLPFDTKLYCSKKEGLEQISSFLKNLSNEISFVNIGCILAEF